MSNEHGTQGTVHKYRIQFVRRVTMAHRLVVYTPHHTAPLKTLNKYNMGQQAL